MWETLSEPWQAALEMAWEAYCAGTVPIGAVITDADGNILSRGRNRNLDSDSPQKQIHGDMLAHAELNALLALDGVDQNKRHGCILYTTMEPCPLCMGAIYMSSVRAFCFAARDPYAGSSNLLGTTWYLSHKPVKGIGPQDPTLEIILMALHFDFELTMHGEDELQSNVTKRWEEIVPQSIFLGEKIYRSGDLREMKQKCIPANQVFNWLAYQVK
jgi:tRNA(adenine34) deaminase